MVMRVCVMLVSVVVCGWFGSGFGGGMFFGVVGVLECVWPVLW